MRLSQEELATMAGGQGHFAGCPFERNARPFEPHTKKRSVLTGVQITDFRSLLQGIPGIYFLISAKQCTILVFSLKRLVFLNSCGNNSVTQVLLIISWSQFYRQSYANCVICCLLFTVICTHVQVDNSKTQILKLLGMLFQRKLKFQKYNWYFSCQSVVKVWHAITRM